MSKTVTPRPTITAAAKALVDGAFAALDVMKEPLDVVIQYILLVYVKLTTIGIPRGSVKLGDLGARELSQVPHTIGMGWGRFRQIV